MREILFRGKTKKGEWVEGFYTQIVECVLPEYKDELYGKFVVLENRHKYFIRDTIHTLTNATRNVIPETVGQYTGLKDCKGNKIFEGDIVKYGNNTGIINYSFGCWCIKLNKPKYRDNPAIDIVFNEYPNEVEIIGNIHDNPKLLKGTNNEN